MRSELKSRQTTQLPGINWDHFDEVYGNDFADLRLPGLSPVRVAAVLYFVKSAYGVSNRAARKMIARSRDLQRLCGYEKDHRVLTLSLQTAENLSARTSPELMDDLDPLFGKCPPPRRRFPVKAAALLLGIVLAAGAWLFVKTTSEHAAAQEAQEAASIEAELLTHVTVNASETLFITELTTLADVVETDAGYTASLEPALSALTDGEQTVTVTVTGADGATAKIETTYEVSLVDHVFTYDLTGSTAEEVLEAYIAGNDEISESNFAFFYYAPETGETYIWNGDTVFLGASTIKVPLCMLFYDLINAGNLTLSSTILYTSSSYLGEGNSTEGTYSVGANIPLSFLLEQSIVNSDNTAANVLISYFGSDAYRTKIAAYSDSKLPAAFYTSNVITAQYNLDVLRYLYENSGAYEDLIADMLDACAGQYLQTDFDEYAVAHKYGSYNGNLHDYAIVYTEEPYLIGVFTKDLGYIESIMGELNTLFMEYTLTNLNA